MGYTHIEDWICEEVGDLYTAMAYSVIARYEKMRQGKCFASMETLAEKGLMSRMTFWRRAQVLIEMGLVRDLTPDRMKASHDLVTVGEGEYKRKKSGLRVSESVSVGDRSVSDRYTSVSLSDRSVSGSYTRNTKGIPDKSTSRNTNPNSQKNKNSGRLRDKGDDMDGYVPGSANYTNGDAVLAYRNICRLRLTEEQVDLIAGAVDDVLAWEALLRRSKMDKRNLADVNALLADYARGT